MSCMYKMTFMISSVFRNVVHASDSVQGAEKEISLWFQSAELIDWEGCDHSNIYHL